jgi:hypothetical protein
LVEHEIVSGGVRTPKMLDAEARDLLLSSGRVGLTSLEFGVMRYLLERPGKAVSRYDLMQAVRGPQERDREQRRRRRDPVVAEEARSPGAGGGDGTRHRVSLPPRHAQGQERIEAHGLRGSRKAGKRTRGTQHKRKGGGPAARPPDPQREDLRESDQAQTMLDWPAAGLLVHVQV